MYVTLHSTAPVLLLWVFVCEILGCRCHGGSCASHLGDPCGVLSSVTCSACSNPRWLAPSSPLCCLCSLPFPPSWPWEHRTFLASRKRASMTAPPGVAPVRSCPRVCVCVCPRTSCCVCVCAPALLTAAPPHPHRLDQAADSGERGLQCFRYHPSTERFLGMWAVLLALLLFGFVFVCVRMFVRLSALHDVA